MHHDHAVTAGAGRCAGIDNRHTLVTELAESGAGDEVIMSIAGHVSRAMLSRVGRSIPVSATKKAPFPTIFQKKVRTSAHAHDARPAQNGFWLWSVRKRSPTPPGRNTDEILTLGASFLTLWPLRRPDPPNQSGRWERREFRSERSSRCSTAERPLNAHTSQSVGKARR